MKILVAVLLATSCVVAQAGDYRLKRNIVIRPTIPGTSAPDYRKRAIVIDRYGVARPTIKGTSAPDYRSKRSYVITR